jgi:hypothetical protein|tara:strand:- start:828 stop:1058 length:231 start_codon:yes stop_codon:yes gene_type:complete
MANNKFDDFYKKFIDKIESMTVNLKEMDAHLAELKESYTSIDEVCLDEIAADKAAYDAIREICLDALLDVEPKGEA